ncbi:MAG: DUF4131 domain-containing protein, partial [Akkermansiaceae bacterium]|nr:DUF4131 domain-containing protein [Akkermansiaceae bacterium]
MITAAVRRWGARVPLLALVAGCLAGIAMAEAGWSPPAAGIPLVAAVVAAVRGRGTWAMGFAAAAVFWLAHGARLEARDGVVSWLGAGHSRQARVEGVISQRQEGSVMRPEAVLRVSRGADGFPAGARLALWRLPPDVLPGDRVRLTADLALPAAARN